MLEKRTLGKHPGLISLSPHNRMKKSSESLSDLPIRVISEM